MGEFVSGNDEATADAASCGADCWKNAIWNTPVAGDYAAEATFRFDTPGDHYNCMMFGMQSVSTQDEWWDCCLDRESASPALSLWHHAAGANTLVKVKDKPSVEDITTPPTAWRRIRVEYRPNLSMQCFFDNELGAHADLQSTADVWHDPTYVGLRAYEAKVHFSSFVVYQ